MTFTRAQIKKQMEKVNKIAWNNRVESNKLEKMCREFYGEESYNDNDQDQIIDCLDYGQDIMSFEEFDRIMREINKK